jgi:hypothetical protein
MKSSKKKGVEHITDELMENKENIGESNDSIKKS